MDARIDDWLVAHEQVASRESLVEVVGRHRLDNEVKTGALVAVFPRTYARPWNADLRPVLLRAALLSVGGEVGLSHITSVQQHDVLVPGDYPIHVTAYNPRHPRSVPGRLIVHRTRLPLDALMLDGLPVVRMDRSVLNSWGLLPAGDRRAPLIEATRRGLVRPRTLLDLAERMWWLAEREELLEVVGLLAAGCESELEMWGYQHVFAVPGLDDARRQVEVRVDGRTYRLDQYYERERLDVELDGRKYHSSCEQRERDIKRDVAVARLGIQTIRFSHDRLRGDVDGCRRDTLAVRAARRPARRAS